MLAIIGAVVYIMAFFPMQMALDSSGPLAVHLLGYALFLVWLAGLIAMPVGIVGTIVRLVQRRRRR